MKKILVALLIACMVLSVSVVALAAEKTVSTFDELKAALSGITEDTTIKLTSSITVDTAIAGITAGGKNVTIDLNGNTLYVKPTVDTNIFSLANVYFTFKNGTMDVSGTTINANRHIVCANTNAYLTFENMTVKGDNFKAYSVLYFNGSELGLDIINTTMEFSNVSGGGSFIHADGGSISSTFNFIDSSLKIENGVRGIGVTGNRTFIAKNSTIDMKNLKDNAFNIIGTAKFDNCTVTVDTTPERGLTLRDGNSSVSLTNGTIFKISNCNSGDIMFKHSTVRDGIISVDASSNIYFDLVTDTNANALSKEGYVNAFELADGYSVELYDADTYYIKAPTPTPAPATPTPAPAAPVVTAAPAAPAPKTGDNTNIALWMSLMLISGVALLGLRKKASK